MNEALAQATAAATAPVDSWRDVVHVLMGQIDIVGVIFTMIVIFLIIMLWRRQIAQEGDYEDFDLTDTIMQNGKVSGEKLRKWGAFVAMTFLLIHQEFKDNLTDWYVLIYGGLWVSESIVRLFRGGGSQEGTSAKP